MEAPNDYEKLLSDVIKKQILILGPDITLAKARRVPGMTVADDGTVTQIQGDRSAITKQLIQEFMELSELIVKKTMEPLLNLLQATPPSATTQSDIDQKNT